MIKNLDIVGRGYRAVVENSELIMNLGFSHDIRYTIPTGIKIICKQPTSITIEGIDKQQVGQVAAQIRSYRPPSPFSGKGIKYSDEIVRRKKGKK